MPISAEDIATAYRMILGRPPESQEVVDFHLSYGFPDRVAFSQFLCATGEYALIFDAIAAAGGPRVPAPPAAAPPARMAINLGDRVLTQTHRGQKIFLLPEDLDLTPHIALHGVWEPHVEQATMALLRPGQRACDIGANIGYHSIAMAAAVGPQGRLDAFEARPDLSRLLEGTFFINGVYPWASVHNLAVMDTPGHITLSATPGHGGSGNVGLTGASYDAYYPQKFQVAAARLDDIFPAHTPPMDLLRIDIEGAEPLALRGGEALIRRSPNLRIVAEWSVAMMSGRADVPAMVDWLESMDFAFWLITLSGQPEPIDRATLLGLPHSDVLIARMQV